MKKTSLLRGIASSAIIILATTPFMVSAADGLFGTYFERMTGSCVGADEAISGFSTTSGIYGEKQCISILDIIRSLLSNVQAPTGQAVIGFDLDGRPILGPVNWARTGTDISYTGGRVGIGTLSPGASLDVSADILINGITLGRGGGSNSSNTVVGLSGLVSNAGSQNTAIGNNTLRNNTTGYANTAIGTNAMQYNTTANQNIAVGVNALLNNSTGQNNTVIGINSMTNNISGTMNIAIGENALQPNTVGIQNVSIGVSSLLSSTTGNWNTVIGAYAGTNLTTGSNNIIIGYGAQVNSTNASNQIRMGNTSVTYAGIQVPWTITSDRNLKADIHSTSLGLEFIRELHPVEYVRNNDASHTIELGFIAQDVESLLQKNNMKNSGMISTDDAGIKSIRYNDFFAPIVRSIQEVDDSVDILKETIEQQNREIELLKSRLEILEENSIQ